MYNSLLVWKEWYYKGGIEMNKMTKLDVKDFIIDEKFELHSYLAYLFTQKDNTEEAAV